MSLFVLREGYRVVTATSGAGRVVHTRTGDALEVSADDVLVLARASAGGLDFDDPAVRGLIKKYAGLGVLVTARHAPPLAAVARPEAQPSMVPVAAPEPIGGPVPAASGGLTVPLFRTDLKVSRQENSALFDVHNPESKKTFQLYDFEVSLARMLDGRRSYAAVVEAAVRLGIPVTVASLSQFIRQLARYGFLHPAGSQPSGKAEQTMWAAREKWEEGPRALFQSGLRMHRQGRYSEAIGYFLAMLEQDGEHPEALEMLAQARQRVAGAGPVTVLPPSGEAVETFDELSLDDAPASGLVAASSAGAGSAPPVIAPLASPPSPPKAVAPPPPPAASPPPSAVDAWSLLASAPSAGPRAASSPPPAPAAWPVVAPPPAGTVPPRPAGSPIQTPPAASPGSAPPRSTSSPTQTPPAASPGNAPARSSSSPASGAPPAAAPSPRPPPPASLGPAPPSIAPMPGTAPWPALAPAASPPRPIAPAPVPPAAPLEPFSSQAIAARSAGLAWQAPKPSGASGSFPAAPPVSLPSVAPLQPSLTGAAMPAKTIVLGSEPERVSAASLFDQLTPPSLTAQPPPPPLVIDDPPVVVAGNAVPAQPAAARPAPTVLPPAPSRSRRPVALAGLAVAVLAGAGIWFATSRPPEPVPTVLPPRPKPRPVAVAVPDAAVEVASDSGSQAVVAAQVDAGSAVAIVPVAAAPDAGVAAPRVVVEAADAAVVIEVVETPPGQERQWTAAKLVRRGRVDMGDLKAPAEGTVTWKEVAEQRVKKGKVVGSFQPKDGSAPQDLLAPADGLLILKVADQGEATASQLLASMLYFEAYLQATVSGTQPAPGWSCEISDETSHERADCKVVTAVPRGAGFFVTATAEPRWIDAAADPKLRLAPPTKGQ